VASADSFQQEKRSRRAWRLAAVVGLGAAVLAGRLFDLQVLGVAEYTLLSERNRIRREWIGAPRGLIVDATGEVLAGTRPSYTVLAIPRRVLPSPSARTLLSELLEIEEETIVERLESGPRHPPRVIRHDVGFEQVSRIAERDDELPGVTVKVARVRSYPSGRLGAHLLGKVGEISQTEMRDLAGRGYRVGDYVGRTGLERVYESELRGVDGERWLEVDAVGRIVGRFQGRDAVPPVPGKTLRLHLDGELQARAESLLVGRRGAVVVLDVRNGGVRTLASAPAFDPNLFATGIGAEDWNRLNTDPERPLLDRTVQAVYAPGSTFKMISFAVTLGERIFGFHEFPETPCYGGYQFGNRWFGCWEEGGHGRLTLTQALVQSCDTYFYQVAENLNVDALARYAREAGLGRRTGIDLPQELAGNVPDSAWLDGRYGQRRWTQGAVLNHIIGQGEYLVTPLQMARHVAAIANGGRLLVPRIVASVEDPASGTVTAIEPAPPETWEISSRTMGRIRDAMELVVLDENGTGRFTKVEGYMPAGKTGTSENPHGADHSWYVGYAPTDAPEIAFAVIVEAGGHGSDTAAPIARQLLELLAARRAGPGPEDPS
jgi:penicillin-binding protein 2